MLTLIPPVHRATHRIGLYLEAGQRDALSQGESHILALLASSSGARPRGGQSMTVGELHEGLAHRRSTLTSILDRLVDRGLVTRDVGPNDRRTVVVATTASGRRAARQVLNRLRALERAVSARVSRADRAGFARVIAAIEAEADARAAARS